ncbi:MAG: bacterioferritin [Polyangiaceae bacterium]|nr:bacterioferritin [Polyangiaceae bacterium]
MKGDPQILALLNDVLAGELVAISQYFLHGKMRANWGYGYLAQHARAESIDEMKHADKLIDRILFLDGLPNLQRLDKLNIGENVREQFQSDLALEMLAVKRLNAGLELCRQKGDGASEELLREILVSEEVHVDWLETQLGLMDKLGEALDLAQQLRA